MSRRIKLTLIRFITILKFYKKAGLPSNSYLKSYIIKENNLKISVTNKS